LDVLGSLIYVLEILAVDLDQLFMKNLWVLTLIILILLVA